MCRAIPHQQRPVLYSFLKTTGRCHPMHGIIMHDCKQHYLQPRGSAPTQQACDQYCFEIMPHIYRVVTCCLRTHLVGNFAVCISSLVGKLAVCIASMMMSLATRLLLECCILRFCRWHPTCARLRACMTCWKALLPKRLSLVWELELVLLVLQHW